MSNRVLPGRPAPEISLPLVGEDKPWQLTGKPAGNFTLLVVYRGLHCPLCRKQLESINERIEAFRERGIEVVAASCDDEEAAQKTRDEWQVDDLPLAYDLPIDEARRWGLYISASIKEEEPGLFSEPAQFLINGDGNIHAVWIQSVPFARPSVDDILHVVDVIDEEDYPPRGTVAEPSAVTAAAH